MYGVFYMLLFVVLVIVCVCDIRRRKIPNGLVVLMIIMGVVFRGSLEGWAGVADFCLGVLVYLVILYPLYKIGVLGAGDIKLLAAVEGCFEWNRGLVFFLVMWIVAAAMALIKMVANKDFVERMEYLLSYGKDVVVSGKWQLYFADRKEAFQKGRYVHMTIPMLIAFMAYLGGFY